MIFPGGRRFAFSILDDTDDATLENVRPVYDQLRKHGLRTTKTVWPLDCPEGSRIYFAADTLARADYLAFVHELAADGFEIALHGATMETSNRERTLRGIEFLEREFARCPRIFANHGQNRENLYWGSRRFATPLLRQMLALSAADEEQFSGEVPGSPYFWGDICERNFDYVRNLTFRSLDMLTVNPEMPYHRSDCPYVRYWFSTTDAPDAHAFCRRLTPNALDRLEQAGGICIISTHLGKGFVRAGRLLPEVERVLAELAGRAGWFVPVSTLLDHLRAQRPERPIGRAALLRLELRFLFERLVDRLSAARESLLRASPWA